MRSVSRILSLMMVFGLIIAIPASTQPMIGSSDEVSTESNLPMLILVNRLELSEEQMRTLSEIFGALIDEKTVIQALVDDFEQAMIAYSGTAEELDALLATFQEDQRALAEALRESMVASFDQIRDLLSVNQGLALAEQLPQLLGRAAMGVGRSSGRVMGSESMGGRQLGLGTENQTGETMREHMQQFFMQRGEQTPEEWAEQVKERMGGALGVFGAQAGQRAGSDQSSGMMMQGGMGQRGGMAIFMQRGRLAQAGHGDLFSILEQIKDVLDLKLEAIE